MTQLSLQPASLGFILLTLVSFNLFAKEKPVYLDTQKSFEDRAADLVSRMTLDEKVSQMQNDAPAIPRLGVPKYEWWNEALHGVARAGSATVFPQAIGLAASFNPELMHQVATVISDEGRAKYNDFSKREQRNRYQGLTFWSPNINIFRDPRWGRGQETYGEDPYLTSQMGVAFVKGLQGDNPVYRKTDATAKHFAVHSGPEFNRHEFDARPTERDLYETYLPAFRALVQDANVAAVMGAYNRVNGESASASQRLLLDILRKEWGFKGYVVSDCDSIEDIFMHHKIVNTAEAAAALGVKKGMDLNCGKTYAALKQAVKQELITEAEIDEALRRLFYTRFRLGMFDPQAKVPYAQIPYSINQSPAHDELARKAAQQSVVLLKNKKLLPLQKDMKYIAVIGPTADDVMSLLGNYYGTPEQPVTILNGIRQAVSSSTQVYYARGTELVEGREDPRALPAIDARFLRPSTSSNEQGLQGEYFRGVDFAGKPVLTRVDTRIDFRWDRGSPTDSLVARGELKKENALPNDQYSVRWTGKIIAPLSGEYEFNVSGNDGVRLLIDNQPIVDAWDLTDRLASHSAKLHMDAGKTYDIKLEYFDDTRDAEIRLSWKLPGAKTLHEEAMDAAKKSEVIIFVGGLTGDVEGEEMKISYPGFMGGDRTDMVLPKPQQDLLEDLVATGKPVVLVLTGGSSLAVDWADKNVPAILMSWYPGQRGGSAVADILFGDVSPSGRLPVTFYKANTKLPDFQDYSMQGRTYRYFDGKPLYAFGHGLSYSSFAYKNILLNKEAMQQSDSLEISLDVKNTGKIMANEVVQIYVRPEDAQPLDAIKNLRAFKSVELKPGESRTLKFDLLAARDFTYYDEEQKSYRVRPGDYEIQVGASSSDIRLKETIRIE
jgi:beta-glucosidase